MTSKANTRPGGSTRRELVPLLSEESFLGMPSQVVSHPGGTQHEVGAKNLLNLHFWKDLCMINMFSRQIL